MKLTSMLRRLIATASGPYLKYVLYNNNPKFRYLAYQMRSEFEPLMVAKGRETYVVRGGDQFIGQMLYSTGEFDFEKLESALRILDNKGRSPKILIDVGANIGSICVPAVARSLVGRCIAIEPDPMNVSLLRANIALNNLSENIEVIASAVGNNKDEKLPLALSDCNFGDNRILTGNLKQEHRKVVEVPSSTLDELCGQIDPNQCIIWMDIQGYEGFALAGATRFVAAQAPLCIEFEPSILSKNNGLECLLDATAGYREFIDLKLDAGHKPRPIADLKLLIDEVDDRGTDILIL